MVRAVLFSGQQAQLLRSFRRTVLLFFFFHSLWPASVEVDFYRWLLRGKVNLLPLRLPACLPALPTVTIQDVALWMGWRLVPFVCPLITSSEHQHFPHSWFCSSSRPVSFFMNRSESDVNKLYSVLANFSQTGITEGLSNSWGASNTGGFMSFPPFLLN